MIRKIVGLTLQVLIRGLWLVGGGRKWHMPLMVWWLKRKGMKITGSPIYISALTWFDGSDYSLIEIGDKCVISSGVRVLTHDYAIARALEAAGIETPSEVAFVRPVKLGNNVFVGTYALLLPGSELGDNVIVGAGTVVKGRIPANAIVAGNPCQVVGDVLEYARRRAANLGDSSARWDG